ncbi:FtsX-like permease family protein [Candidatus Dojkabacteria bacterium]|nr:FtsX-like permease family protein [Candidatus Dojkabacteria bacterium]
MSPLSTIILGVSATVAALIVISAGLSPIARKIGFRNITRRIDNTVMVILGSMVGAALISGSLVLSDSLDRTFTNLVEKYSGEVDALITIQPKKVFESKIVYLDGEEYGEIEDAIVKDDIDGILPVMQQSISPQSLDINGDPDLNIFMVDLVAMDFDKYSHFGMEPTIIEAPREPNDVYINQGLAKKLELEKGDTIRVPLADTYFDFNVAQIFDDGVLLGDLSVTVDINTFNPRLGLPAEGYNYVYISKAGGLKPEGYNGPEFKTELEDRLSTVESNNVSFSVVELKEQALNGYGMKVFADFFLVMSSFGIFAGILLIINLYMMLAAERKYEMGILRAIALTRSQLMRTFIYEGFAYSILSSIVGTIFGVGIGYALVYALDRMFLKIMTLIGKEDLLRFAFDVQIDSLIIAFAFGFLITVCTAIFSSYRISRLNIVSAIRNSEEEKVSRFNIRWFITTIILAVLTLSSLANLAFFFTARDYMQNIRDQGGNALADMSETQFNENVAVIQSYSLYMGIVFSLIFGTFLFNRLFKMITKKDISRVTVTISSLAAITFSSQLSRFDTFIESSESMMSIAIFFLAGVVLVIAMSLIVTYNLSIITAITTFLFSRSRKMKAVTKIAFRYPSVDKVKTGLTLIMFSIVIFLIVYTSMMKVTMRKMNQDSLNETLGGYEVIIMPSYDVDVDTVDEIAQKSEESQNVQKATKITHTRVIMPEYKYKDLDDVAYYGNPLESSFDEDSFFITQFDALPEDFILDKDIKLAEKLDVYENDEEAWKDVINDDSKVILGAGFTEMGYGKRPALELGDKVQIGDIMNQSSKEFEIVGFVDPGNGGMFGEGSFYSFVITSQENLSTNFSAQYIKNLSNSEILVKFENGSNVVESTKTLKRNLISYNIMQIMELEQLTATAQSFMEMMILMFQGFLGFSLVVGASGLAIIVARSVQERRQQIGMLRSLGFHKRMILLSFFLEATFITFLGIIIGISMGTLGALNEFYIEFHDQPDAKPVFAFGEVIAISLIVYLASLLFSLWPSIQASRLSPVEATNYPE